MNDIFFEQIDGSQWLHMITYEPPRLLLFMTSSDKTFIWRKAQSDFNSSRRRCWDHVQVQQWCYVRGRGVNNQWRRKKWCFGSKPTLHNGIQDKGHNDTTVKIVAGEIVFQVNAKDKDDSLNMYWSSYQSNHHQLCINYYHSLWAVLETAIIIFSHCYFHNYAH